jgi:hypothetical protein
MGEGLQRNKNPSGGGLPNNITYPNTDTMNKLKTINKKYQKKKKKKARSFVSWTKSQEMSYTM